MEFPTNSSTIKGDSFHALYFFGKLGQEKASKHNFLLKSNGKNDILLHVKVDEKSFIQSQQVPTYQGKEKSRLQ